MPLAALACADPTLAVRQIEGPMRLGRTAYVSGPRVRPLRLVEDSRCPTGARCVWAGRVVLRVRVSGGSWSRVVDLTLREPVMVADGQLTLVSVTPDRIASRATDPRRLRFRFNFEGGL